MKRNTIQRTVVHEMLRAMANHPTADQVYAEVNKKYPGISRGTVYRNLNQLAEGGVITKLEVPSGADCFDHKTNKHYHAKCDKCKCLFDLEVKQELDLKQMVVESDNFSISGYSVLFYGRCTQCSE